MKAIKFMKTFTCDVPVFENGEPTGERTIAVKAMFVTETVAVGGLKTQRIYGSLFLDSDITEEQANEILSADKDYSNELTFLPIEDSTFYKVVLK
jgi:hypothetical protein